MVKVPGDPDMDANSWKWEPKCQHGCLVLAKPIGLGPSDCLWLACLSFLFEAVVVVVFDTGDLTHSLTLAQRVLQAV